MAIPRHQRLGLESRWRTGIEPKIPGPAQCVLFFLGDVGDRAGLPSRYQIPRPTLLPQFWGTALFIGSYTRNEPGLVVIDEHWWENDGVVNTRSMAGPTLDAADRIVPWRSPPQPGVWNDRGILSGWDHMDIVGIGTTREVGDWYLRLAKSLADLPK